MPNTNTPLPIECPKCHQDGCLLVVRSATIILAKCVTCDHSWAADLDSLPNEVQQKVDAVLDKDR